MNRFLILEPPTFEEPCFQNSMTQTLEWRNSKKCMLHIKGAKCIELSCQRNDAEKSTGPSTCWGAHLLQQTTEQLHACATYLYMCTCWCMHSLQQTTEKLLDSDLTLVGSTTYDCNTYIKSHWYLWMMVYTCKNHSIHQSNLSVCKSIAARCQYMHRIHTNTATDTSEANGQIYPQQNIQPCSM